MLKNLLSYKGGKLPGNAMKEYKQRLTEAYQRIKPLFDDVEDIKTHLPTRAAQFFWLDLRAYLNRVPDEYQLSSKYNRIDLLNYPESDESETRLLKYIAAEAKVQLLPGKTLSCIEPGFFRLCFTCEETSKVEAAIKQMIFHLEALPKSE